MDNFIQWAQSNPSEFAVTLVSGAITFILFLIRNNFINLNSTSKNVVNTVTNLISRVDKSESELSKIEQVLELIAHQNSILAQHVKGLDSTTVMAIISDYAKVKELVGATTKEAQNIVETAKNTIKQQEMKTQTEKLNIMNTILQNSKEE